ncbi:hypothetical protein JG688_00000187 [Phytophthora aleatoria]|uniref:Uncharacterized protein n=1 Tax=Phytophthora aleatoria TaxID=2496075 RepID=A0A8J5JEE0_9STRA|nr:hypothetical protein JG688_00000187 [Phytophthora aleatoria]
MAEETKAHFSKTSVSTTHRDIVTKIHHWKQTSTKESKTKAPRKRQDLFAELVKKEVGRNQIDSGDLCRCKDSPFDN